VNARIRFDDGSHDYAGGMPDLKRFPRRVRLPLAGLLFALVLTGLSAATDDAPFTLRRIAALAVLYVVVSLVFDGFVRLWRRLMRYDH